MKNRTAKLIPLLLVSLMMPMVAAALYSALTMTITVTGPLAVVGTKDLSISVNAGDSASQAEYEYYLNVTSVASTSSKIKLRIYILNPTDLRNTFDSFAINATAFTTAFTVRAGGTDTGMVDCLGLTYTYLHLTGANAYYIKLYLTYTVKPTATSGTVSVPIFADVIPET